MSASAPTAKYILFEETEKNHDIHIEASLKCLATGRVDPNYRDLCPIMRKHLREEIRRMLYGKVQEDARAALRTILEELRYSSSVSYTNFEKIEAALAPLINAGEELVKE